MATQEQVKTELPVVHNGRVGEALGLQRVAKGLFQSGLFPNTRNEFGAFAIIEYGHEMGISPMMALQNINIINGKLACNGQLILSKAIEKGVTYKVTEETDQGCTIEFTRNDNTYTSTFDAADAKAAALLGKSNWKQYPRDMYFWRAVAKGIRRVAPDAIMGLYTPDELSGGEIIDVEAEEIPTNATVVENDNGGGYPPYVKKADLIEIVLALELETFDSDALRDTARQGSLGGKTPEDATVKELTAYREALNNQQKMEAEPDRTTIKRALMALEDEVYPGGKAYTNARKKHLNNEVDLGKADLALMVEYGKHMKEKKGAA